MENKNFYTSIILMVLTLSACTINPAKINNYLANSFANPDCHIDLEISNFHQTQQLCKEILITDEYIKQLRQASLATSERNYKQARLILGVIGIGAVATEEHSSVLKSIGGLLSITEGLRIFNNPSEVSSHLTNAADTLECMNTELSHSQYNQNWYDRLRSYRYKLTLTRQNLGTYKIKNKKLLNATALSIIDDLEKSLLKVQEVENQAIKDFDRMPRRLRYHRDKVMEILKKNINSSTGDVNVVLQGIGGFGPFGGDVSSYFDQQRKAFEDARAKIDDLQNIVEEATEKTVGLSNAEKKSAIESFSGLNTNEISAIEESPDRQGNSAKTSNNSNSGNPIDLSLKVFSYTALHLSFAAAMGVNFSEDLALAEACVAKR